MNASSWCKLTEGAMKRLATRYSEPLTLVSQGDAGGYRVSTYAIAPRREIARAGAEELGRYLRLATSSCPGRGQDAMIEVAAGGSTATRWQLVTVGEIPKAALDITIDRAIDLAVALTPFDLTAEYAVAPC